MLLDKLTDVSFTGAQAKDVPCSLSVNETLDVLQLDMGGERNTTGGQRFGGEGRGDSSVSLSERLIGLLGGSSNSSVCSSFCVIRIFNG